MTDFERGVLAGITVYGEHDFLADDGVGLDEIRSDIAKRAANGFAVRALVLADRSHRSVGGLGTGEMLRLARLFEATEWPMELAE